MNYTAIKANGNNYEIKNEQDENIAQLDFSLWVPGKATITCGNDLIYTIKGKGFWQTTKQLFRNEILLATIRPNYRMGFNIYFENGHTFVFKRKSIWKNYYITLNEDEQTIAFVIEKYNWKILSFNYDVNVNANSMDNETNSLFPIILIYCIRQLKIRA